MSRTLCPECNANRGLATYANGSYCFSCQYKSTSKSLLKQRIYSSAKKIQEEDLDTLPQKALIYLRNLYITNEHIEKYSLKWATNYDRISVPVSNGYWLRDISGTARNKWLFVGEGSPDLWAITEYLTNTVVIVEDIFSAIRVADHQNVVCLGGTNINNKQLEKHIREYHFILTWLDGDNAGQTAAENFRTRYKLLRYISNIRTKKDPKNHTPTEIQEILS